jgi:ssRNA-specific RNase YbeY (16S rRNA maturation enzyme)
VLHLLGYDHDEPARGRRMRALEKGVLSEVGKDSRK